MGSLVLNVVLVKAFEFELDHVRWCAMCQLLTRLLHFNFLLVVLRLVIRELDTALIRIMQRCCLQEQSFFLRVELLSIVSLCILRLGLLNDEVCGHRDLLNIDLLLGHQPVVIR